MSLLSKFKDWITGKDEKKKSTSTSSVRSANRITNYGGGGASSITTSKGSVSPSGTASIRKAAVKKKKEENEKKKQLDNAFAVTERKAGQTTKAKTPTDPKEAIRQEKAQKRKVLLEAYHVQTNNRYNVAGAATPAEALKRRQAQKSQAFDADAAKFDVDNHPIATSLARGGLSGVTFGGSELLAKYAPMSESAREAEQYYQENKSKGAEFAGEVAGSLASFGLTGGLSASGAKAAASKLAPRMLEKTTAGATEKLAASALVRRAAEKEAIKRFGVEGATKEVITQLARRKAEQAVAELGKDAAINLTTGLAADVSHSILDSSDENGNIDWSKFAKNMGTNALLNTALGGATSLVPAFRAGKTVLPEAVEGAVRSADDAITPAAKQVDEVVAPVAKNIDNAAAEAEKISAQSQADVERILKEESGLPYAQTEDAMPVDDIAQTRRNDQATEAERRAKEVMQKEPVVEAEAKTEPKAETKAAEPELTQGQKDAREAYAKQTGEKFGKDTKPASFDDKWSALKAYEKSQGQSAERKLSKAAASQVRVSDAEQAKIIDNLIKNSDSLEYDVVHHKQMYEEVAKNLNDDWDRWVDRIADIAEGGDWNGKEATKLLATAQYLSEITDASKSPEAAALADQAFKAIKSLSSSSAQTLNMRRAFVHLSEASKMENAIDDLVKILDPAVGFNNKHKKALAGLNAYERQHYIKGQLMSDPKIKECVQKLVNAKSEDAVSEAYTELLLNFNKHHPKSGFDVMQELRYLNMLGNPKTHIRNIFGSALFSPMRTISNTVRSGIEGAISKKTGLEVTRHGGISLEAAIEARAKKPKTEAGKKALEAFEARKKDILGSAKYDNQMYKGRGKTAAGKFLDTLSDLNSNLLSKEDDFFRTRAFKENYIKSYNKYLKKGVPITEKIEKQIEQEAIRESQIATFNEYNSLADFLNKIERKAYDAKASTGARMGGAALNAVMPFTKVPANILNESINYSPAGIARGYANIAKAAKTGDAQLLNKAIDELSSGLTGSGIMALGYFLGKNTDAFTTNAGKDDYAAKFKKAQGVQNYSVTFTDPKTGKTTSATLDWLVPTSSVFFMGVELANQMKSGDFEPTDFAGDWAQITSRLIEPVMETSMLSGLYSTLESMRSSYGDDDKQSALSLMMRETAQSYLNSLVPTVSGQIARTAYKSDKQVTGETDWEYFKNSMKSKTGLAADNALTRKLGIEPLGADTTAYGDVKGEKKSKEDYIKSGLKNFLSPANIQNVDLSELDKEKIKQYEEAVKNGADPKDMSYLFPKKQYKKQFSVGDMDVKMSNKDLSTYNQAKTSGGEEAMRLALEGIMFNRYEKDDKGKRTILKNGYTADEKQELIKAAKGMSMREIEQWLYEQPQFKSASEAEQRKVINHMWSLSGQGKSQGAKRVGEQAVIKAQGGDVNEYNYKNEITKKKQEALQSAIDSGIVTYEEAVDFARNAGKTYYYENDEGGSASTYYNKKEMIEYLTKKGYSYEKAEALFNAFKASNAKPYSGNDLSSGRRGYRRRGYRRRGRGGGGSSLVSGTINSSAYSVKKFNPKATVPTTHSGSSSSGSKALAEALNDLQKVEAKIKPPKNK